MFASNGNAEPHFDNARLEECIARFQREGDIANLNEIVELSQRRALTLIRFDATMHLSSTWKVPHSWKRRKCSL